MRVNSRYNKMAIGERAGDTERLDCDAGDLLLPHRHPLVLSSPQLLTNSPIEQHVEPAASTR